MKSAERSAPKPPLVSYMKQMPNSSCQRICHPVEKYCKDLHTYNNNNNNNKCISLSGDCKDEISKTYFDKNVHGTDLLFKNMEQCQSDLPPELPMKKTSHDTKTLFGYTLEDRIATRKLNVISKANQDSKNYSELTNTSAAGCVSCTSVAKKLPQFNSSTNCTNTHVKNNISRNLFYKSLSSHSRKKSSCMNVAGKNKLKTYLNTGFHSNIVPLHCAQANDAINTSNQNFYRRKINEKNVISNIGFPNTPRHSFMKTSNDINIKESSQAGTLPNLRKSLDQQPEVVTLYENISVPMTDTDKNCNFKLQCKNSIDNHLPNKDNFLEKRTNHICFLKSACSNVSVPNTNNDHVKLCPVSQAGLTYSSQSHTFAKNRNHILGKINNKLSIKEIENVSTEVSITDTFSKERVFDAVLPSQRISKNNSYIKKPVNIEIKCKKHESNAVDDDNSIHENTKNNQKRTEQFSDDVSEITLEKNTHSKNLEDITAELIKSRKNNSVKKCFMFPNFQSDTENIPKSVNLNKSIFPEREYRLKNQQNIMETMTNPFSLVHISKLQGLHSAKKNLIEMEKSSLSEQHSFPLENDSLCTGYKVGVNTQNRNSEICSYAKSARLLQESSTLTDIQQTSTTSEISRVLKLGPNKINNQDTLLFPVASTMSTQQLNYTKVFRQLEAAIANGQHKKAAILARKLALHKVACSLNYPNISEQIKEEPIMVNLYIEDKNLHQGPFPLLVHSSMMLGELKSKLAKEFALPQKLQRWILGKQLATDDETTLQDYGVTETGCSIFLYLIYCDSSDNKNLFETLSEMLKNVTMHEDWESNSITFHEESKKLDSVVHVLPDTENTLDIDNISQDEDFSDEQDSYSVNSTCMSPVSDNDFGTEEIETDESESQTYTPVRYFTPGYEETEANEKNVNENLFSLDFVVTREQLLKEQESTSLNDEQNRNEINNKQMNELHTATDDGIGVISINGFIVDIEDDENSFPEEQTEKFYNPSHIPMLNGKKQETVREQELHSYSPCAEGLSTIHDDFNCDAKKEQVCEENEVTCSNVDSEYISLINRAALFRQDEKSLMSGSMQAVAFPAVANQQLLEFEKQKVEGDEQHGYLPHMEYVGVINELDTEADEENVYEENQIKFVHDVNYAISTAVELSGKKVEDLHDHMQIETPSIWLPRMSPVRTYERMEKNAFEKQVEAEEEQHGYLPDMEYIAVINEFGAEIREEKYEENQIETYNTALVQIPMSEEKLPRISVIHTAKKGIEQNASASCASCGSLQILPSEICELCTSVVNLENTTVKVNDKNSIAETSLVRRSSDCSKETITDYQLLVQLDNQDLIPNAEPFCCPVCFTDIPERQGVVLRDCLHQFCKDCLAGSVEYAEGTIVKCPFRNEEYLCNSHLQEREIKAVVTAEVFERYLRRGMLAAEGRTDNSFHCKTPDCPGWCILDGTFSSFQCPVCSHINCLRCQAIHEGLNCEQYQDELEYQVARNEEVKETKSYLENLVKEGKAMLCPKCDAFVIKRWGCDWLKCSVCQTEICWVTKKARWGPEGHGDTSDGCKCGVNGQRCHPKCNYCH